MSCSGLLPEFQETRNKMKERTSKDLVKAAKYLENKTSSSLFSVRGKKRGSCSNCCVPSRRPELIHLDTESENIPNPLYTQATADKLAEQCDFILWTSKPTLVPTQGWSVSAFITFSSSIRSKHTSGLSGIKIGPQTFFFPG